MNKNENLKIIYIFKGFSILMIVLYHLVFNFLNVPNIIKTFSSYGGAGVHIFFILSGFGLYYSFLKKGFHLKDYVKKRVFRTYLPYIFIILISACLPFMYEGEDRAIAVLSHILLFKMAVPRYESSFGVQMWYMSTIFQFYLVFPILINFLKKIDIKKVFFISIIISLVWATISSIFDLNNNICLNYFFLQYIWEFVLGMYFCKLYVNNKISIDKINVLELIVIFISTFLIYGIMSIKGGFLKNYNDIFSVVSFGALTLIIYKMKIFNNILTVLGKYSYEIYLTHYLVMSITFNYLKSSSLITALLTIVLVFVVAYVFGLIKNVIYYKNNKSIKVIDGTS